jgi:RNA polymerase sigma-70 factor, ECF subfamily
VKHSAAIAVATIDDADLVARLQQREPAAFEQMVRAHGPRMLAVAKRFLRNDDDAADVLQEAFVSAYRAIDKFAAESKLGTWLHRIVVNAALMRLRTRQRKPEVSIETLLPQFLEDGHQVKSTIAWPDSSQSLERRETHELVRRLIDQLPDGYREVLLIRDIDGLDTEEAANLLGLSVSALKVRLHRARQALRTLLDPHMQGGLL